MTYDDNKRRDPLANPVDPLEGNRRGVRDRRDAGVPMVLGVLALLALFAGLLVYALMDREGPTTAGTRGPAPSATTGAAPSVPPATGPTTAPTVPPRAPDQGTR